jgi:3',5'-cyclic AMP phosphodiesterase CpdA
VTAALLHVSDLHVGAGPCLGEETLGALRKLVARHEPELIVASGDLTHRNRASQHRKAAEFLRSLALPVVAVPGNHDIPAFPPQRFTRTHRAFREVWGEVEPTYSSPELTVAGVSSVRPWLYQEGIVSKRQLAQLARDLEQHPGAARVLVTHHHLASAPWRTAKRPLARRSSLLQELARLGVDLVLAGHVHQTSAASAPEFYVEAARGVVVSTTAGLGRPRPGRPAEVRGCQVWEIAADELRATTYGWLGDDLSELARRSFPR